jgi:hypothetical protein
VDSSADETGVLTPEGALGPLVQAAQVSVAAMTAHACRCFIFQFLPESPPDEHCSEVMKNQ